jgi:hypothetical protein
MTEIISNKGTNGTPLTDKNGNPIQGAEIIAVSHGLNTDAQNQVIAVTQTDSNGEYAFTDQDLPSTYISGDTPKTEYLDLYARIGSETDIRQATPIRPWQGYQLEGGVPPSVIYRWKLDEGSETTINDSVGSLTGTLNGSANWVFDSNSVGGAHIDFDGSDDFIDLGDVTNEAQFSAAFWANPDNLSSATPQDVIFWSTNTGNSTGANISMFSDDLKINIEGSVTFTSFSPLEGEWNHYAFSYDSSGSLDFYLNGTLEEIISIGDGNVSNGTRDFHIAKDSFGGDRFFDGQLDDIIVADSPLSSSEVKDLYNLSPRA